MFFFKQKTAYEMRISDWRSDVCSSDLPRKSAPIRTNECQSYGATCRIRDLHLVGPTALFLRGLGGDRRAGSIVAREDLLPREDRKSVVTGKSVSVRVDLGGRRIIKKKEHTANH